MSRNVLVGICALAVVGTAGASVVPFTEEFDAGVSNWRDIDGADTLSWFAAGGPDGSGYVSTSYTVPDPIPPTGVILFRGQDAFDSSNDAFVGNWISDGVREFSFWLRHDSVAPLGVFGRFANPNNFPGAAGVSFIPVAPNTWTEVIIPISAASPNIFLEGTGYNDVFSNIGNVQIGASVTAGMIGQTITVDIDKVSITPAPGTLGLLFLGALSGGRRRRR